MFEAVDALQIADPSQPTERSWTASGAPPSTTGMPRTATRRTRTTAGRRRGVVRRQRLARPRVPERLPRDPQGAASCMTRSARFTSSRRRAGTPQRRRDVVEHRAPLPLGPRDRGGQPARDPPLQRRPRGVAAAGRKDLRRLGNTNDTHDERQLYLEQPNEPESVNDYVQAPLIYAQYLLCKDGEGEGYCVRAGRTAATMAETNVSKAGFRYNYGPEYDAIYLQWMMAYGQATGDPYWLKSRSSTPRAAQLTPTTTGGLWLAAGGAGRSRTPKPIPRCSARWPRPRASTRGSPSTAASTNRPCPRASQAGAVSSRA